MNNQITKLVDILSETFEISFGNNKVYEPSVYISIKYALLSQDCPLTDRISSNSFYKILNCKYPRLVNIYESIEKELGVASSDNIIEDLENCLKTENDL